MLSRLDGATGATASKGVRALQAAIVFGNVLGAKEPKDLI
jgi:hypothetical protein